MSGRQAWTICCISDAGGSALNSGISSIIDGFFCDGGRRVCTSCLGFIAKSTL